MAHELIYGQRIIGDRGENSWEPPRSLTSVGCSKGSVGRARLAAYNKAIMKVAIFNVKYSPNLGDGIIAECLERAIRQRTGCAVESIDLAGRTRWSDPVDGGARALVLTLIQRMPGWLRDASVTLLLGRRVKKRFRPQWIRLLKGVDFAVFGGGQLFQDADLNFPIKIAAAVAECGQKHLPMAVFAVGATPIRSTRGRLLLERLLGSRHLVYTAVRDSQSRDALFSMGYKAELCRDPGLLAARIWPAQIKAARPRPLVGLCIAHPAVLGHHSSRYERLSSADATALYAATARSLVAGGFDLRCFTNGAGEDEKLLAAARPHLLAADPSAKRVTFARRRENPRELSELIASCDAIVAHRLHAAILAYSYRVPAIGLRWDEKVSSFFESVGRGAFAVTFDSHNAAQMAVSVRKAIAEGIDAEMHTRVLRETARGIDRLVDAIAIHSHLPNQTWDQLPELQRSEQVGARNSNNAEGQPVIGTGSTT